MNFAQHNYVARAQENTGGNGENTGIKVFSISQCFQMPFILGVTHNSFIKAQVVTDYIYPIEDWLVV